MKLSIVVALLVVMALGGVGCAAGRAGAMTDATIALEAQRAALIAVNPETIPIFAGDSGEPMAWEELVERASEADVVLVGEMHGHPVGLAVAADLFEQIVPRAPSTVALSLEFFDRDRQNAIDDYLTSVTDEAGFDKAAGRTDANYPPGHRAMVEAAKGAEAPVYASNAPRRYVHLANADGYDRLRSLTVEQRRLFVVPDKLLEGPYRERFFEVMSSMGGHGGSDDSAKTDEEVAQQKARLHEQITGMFRSQNVWEATMAGTIADGLAAGRMPIVQIVGEFHVDFDGGLAQRLRAAAPDARILTISMTDETGAEFNDANKNRADVVIHVGEGD